MGFSWGTGHFIRGVKLPGTGTHSLMATQEQLLAALSAVNDPNTGKDFVTPRR